ncbi:MAG: hypothetical protein IJ391_02880, partial [Clostridia bacterium]|nr:hypothetical protein [Clostridia bacterium]
INAVNKAKDADVLEVKYRFERYSRSCVILLSKDLSQVYTVHYYSDNDFSGYGFSYDMKYLYDKEDCIEIKPYTAYTTDIDYGDTYRYGKYNTNVKVPWFISDKELNQNCELMYKYNCSGYGVGGEFQITCSDGIIYTDDMRSSPYSMMPIAAIHPCSNLRPIIDGIIRYKFIIKFPDGEECPHYVECRTGDMSKAVELLANYDWVYDDICKNPKKYIKSIEVVPDGEWF